MLAESSNNPAQELRVLKEAAGRRCIPWKSRLLMLGLNFIPLFHIGIIGVPLMLPYASLPVRICVAVALLYFAPPVLARLVLGAAGSPQGRIRVGSKAFFVWWFVFQLQIVFCRLTALEEVLRLVPGLYSQWLRLWGSRIGRFTYWSPGTLITDRSFLSIGDDVVLGAGVRLNPHVLAKGKNGELELLLGTVRVGDRVQVGGYSLLTAGTEIQDGEVTRAFLISPPFS
jgi:acetyltransferase-like isoleucine patch superfamily enzyme